MLLCKDLDLHRIDNPVPLSISLPHVQRHPIQSAITRILKQETGSLLKRLFVKVEIAVVAAAAASVIVAAADGREDGVGLVQVVA